MASSAVLKLQERRSRRSAQPVWSRMLARRLLLPLLALLMLTAPTALIAVPASADEDTTLRIHRPLQAEASQAGSDRQSDWAEDFAQPPANNDASSRGPEFTVDVSRTAPRQPTGLSPALSDIAGRAAGLFIKRLSGRDLQVLSTRDVVILIDKSGSMGDRDCPAPTDGLRFPYRDGTDDAFSRWDWCENQLTSFAQEANSALPGGIRVVLFDGNQTVFDHVRFNQVANIFHTNWPEGGTNEAAAVKSQLEWYLNNRYATGMQTRPVVIAVITDGLPNSPGALKHAIIDATKRMNRPDEVAITFLQIGRDKKGISLVHELDDNLVNEGARWDIVDCKDFAEIVRMGLGRALVDAINEASTAPSTATDFNKR